ncbi:cytochrome P450 83B1-like isoform X2 [Gossypium arboreum]|uniref:cytochrome P450 83B1-like isoform X2 n=1 Tax=Gossypium arboreum TaxID=29729 RepID=UPI0022F1C4C0|nr:cytochrome P450 83B1-like isoform X2 [Gossypium arboreum]
MFQKEVTMTIALFDIFIAGTDAAAATMIWVMSFLMKNPKCLKKAQVEVRDLVGEKGFVNEDDVQGLIYLKAVIKETFRLQPVAPLLLPRETRRKCSIGGYEVPAKTLVYVNAWAIGREPEAWENPQDFCPERLIGSSIDYKGLNFELIPFGAGRRVCPGMHMGVAEVELGLANLLYKFDWEMPNGMNREDLDFDAVNGLTTHKKNAVAEVELGLANLLYKFDWEMPNGMNREDLDFDAVNVLTTHKKNALILQAKKIND